MHCPRVSVNSIGIPPPPSPTPAHAPPPPAPAPSLLRFLSRQSRTSWDNGNLWVAVLFGAAAALLKLYLDTNVWTLSIEQNKRQAFTYGTLYMLSLMGLIIAGFLIAA